MPESGRRQRIRHALQSPAIKPTPHYTMTFLKKSVRAAGQPPISAQEKELMREAVSIFNIMYNLGQTHFRSGYCTWDEEEFLQWCNYSGGHDAKSIRSHLLHFYHAYQKGYKDAERGRLS